MSDRTSISLKSDGTLEEIIISTKDLRKSRPSIDYTPYDLNIGGKYNFALKITLSVFLVLILIGLIVICVLAALGEAPNENESTSILPPTSNGLP